ncbi:tetratricopeptide repeat protein [Lysobacter solisilvae (ex Woo and Kim 2020)]|uniref:Tetratricopeptide repeat protein n=1 Tax=Agrilutibacter terrestris TaxID=2865112 RepID=A0A7H0FWX7_9GAMM|nr:tetratricopeptide repeat protein [Lysobacter terrestris]QNP40543.1 tetratricopeptide repeat protein [Lysobacter terrestris]
MLPVHRLLTLSCAAVLALSACRNASPVADATPAPAVSPPQMAMVGAHLLEGLGDYHFPVTSKNPEVQRWFDQGLMLTFGFNHDAAERSFLKATELDPECAMCWWGASLVLGPHVNAAMDPGDNADAWTRLQRARALAPQASERERAFIQALSARYAEHPPANRRALDEAYAESTRQLVQQRPDDLDAAVFHAEALMDLQPWDYYDEKQQPKGGTAEVVSTLESVMARNPDHAGALHLYVHAVEASSAPQRGAAAADHLRTLIPGSGHLVHMPAHIYARVGRWHDAVLANQRAIEADDAYLALCRGNTQGVYPLGYVPHNHHFLWFASSMEGSSAIAHAAARTTSERTNLQELMRKEGFAGLQHYWMTPWFERVRFGRWDEIAKEPNPAPDLPYVTAIWHYAQGMAAVRQKRLDDARKHLDALRPLAADPLMDKLMVWDRYPLAHSARIAERMVTAELAAANGEHDAAIKALQEAVAIEDRIPYDEPPGWHAPVRHTLGAVLLDAGRPAEAERVYREELRRNPGNGWSLFGLAQSLRMQKKTAEAARVQRDFAAAWRNADVKLSASRM